MIRSFLYIRQQQTVRIIQEIGIIRLIIIVLFFVVMPLFYLSTLCHQHQHDLFFGFISGEWVVLCLWLGSLVIFQNARRDVTHFLKGVLSAKHMLIVHIIDSSLPFIIFCTVCFIPYPNFKIFILGILAQILSLSCHQKITLNSRLTMRLFSTPFLLELSQYFRQLAYLFLYLLFTVFLFIGHIHHNVNMIFVFECIIILMYSFILSYTHEPLYFMLQYNLTFQQLFYQKLRRIGAYSLIIFLPIFIVIAFNNASFLLYIPLVLFYFIQPFLLLIKYATYPHSILNLILQNVFLMTLSFSALYVYPFVVVIIFVYILFKKAKQNYNQLFYVTHTRAE